MGVNYDDSSIGQLIGADRIRTRPASMLGSSSLDGAKHGFTEIYGNSLDEHSAGFGKQLDIKYYKDASVSVRDYGRGVPLGWNNNEKIRNWNWHTIYNELYAGGKYETNQEALSKIKDWSNFDATQFSYLYSVGLNGLGAASTQYTSEYFVVKSYRDGKCTSRSFERGIPLVNGKPFDMFTATQEEIESIPEEICDTDEPNGTFVHWKPDDSVFDGTDMGADWLFETCKDIAGVAGITLVFENECTGEKVTIQGGTLRDVVESHGGDSLVRNEDGDFVTLTGNNFTHGTIKVEGKPYIYVCECEVVISFTKSEIPHACYHNLVRMKDGMQYEGIRDALFAFLQERGRVEGLKISNKDYMDFFQVVVSTKSNYASFRNQTKDAVDDVFIYTIVKETVLDKLRVEFGKRNAALLKVVNQILEETRTRITTEAYREVVKKSAKIKKEKLPDKFASCDAYEQKRYSEVELWITEGDSAKGSVKDARSKAFQAVFAIRGKGLNVAKASIKKILENKEIRGIFRILGVGFDINVKGETLFDINDLKVGKIIIATDADEDGYQIRVLVFLIFYVLAPKLLTGGYVYIAESPRFGIDLTDGTRLYARNDAHRDQIKAEYGSRVKRIERYKGLGEVDAEVLRETTVAPEHRTLIPVTVDFNNETERELIDALFGADKYGQRKAIISAVLGSNVMDMIEDNALLLDEIEDSDIEDETEYEVV